MNAPGDCAALASRRLRYGDDVAREPRCDTHAARLAVETAGHSAGNP